MLTNLPEGLTKYSESPKFDQDTLPLALQKKHRTKPGCWAKAIISEGSINYILEENPDEVFTLTSGQFAIIEPEEPHHVELIGPVIFHLEFYKKSF